MEMNYTEALRQTLLTTGVGKGAKSLEATLLRDAFDGTRIKDNLSREMLEAIVAFCVTQPALISGFVIGD